MTDFHFKKPISVLILRIIIHPAKKEFIVYSIESDVYQNSELKDFLTPANVVKAARFVLSLHKPAFEKQYLFQANQLRAVLKHALYRYLEPSLPLPRLCWILHLEQEIVVLLRLIKTLYPLLTVSACDQLMSHLNSTSELPEKYRRKTASKYDLSCRLKKALPTIIKKKDLSLRENA